MKLGSLAEKRLVLPSQQNDVYRAIEDGRLVPSEFRWAEVYKERTSVGPDEAFVSTLTHIPSGYSFCFDLRGSPFYATLRPGRESPSQFEPAHTWADMVQLVHVWLACVKREVESPDLWAAVTQESRLIEAAAAEPEASPFTSTQQEHIVEGLNEIKNHLTDIVAIDFFTVPTATFRILFCFIVLRHDRRTVVHFNVTANPTAGWTAQQVVEAFPEETTLRFLIRDRDSIYGECFHQRIKHMGIEQLVTAPRSPWQSPYVERIIGSIRRDCLDHVIVLNESHLRRILSVYFTYYHEARAHLSLYRNSPIPREIEPPDRGNVIAFPHIGGLHHRYRRAA